MRLARIADPSARGTRSGSIVSRGSRACGANGSGRPWHPKGPPVALDREVGAGLVPVGDATAAIEFGWDREMTTPALPRRKRIQPPATFRERRFPRHCGSSSASAASPSATSTATSSSAVMSASGRSRGQRIGGAWTRPSGGTGGETERAYLERHPELLLPAERARLRRMARKAKALEPARLLAHGDPR